MCVSGREGGVIACRLLVLSPPPLLFITFPTQKAGNYRSIRLSPPGIPLQKLTDVYLRLQTRILLLFSFKTTDTPCDLHENGAVLSVQNL